MLRTLQSDVLKILCCVAASLALASALAPWIYNLGMGLAEVTEGKETNGLLSWLGDAARRSEDNFPRFFDRSLLLSAFLFLWPLLAWLRVGRRRASLDEQPWSPSLSDSAVQLSGQQLSKNSRGWVHLVFGFLLAGGLLLISGWLMVKAGFFMWRDAAESTHGVVNPYVADIDWMKSLKKALPSSIVVSLIEEVLFRGILLGIFLRAMKPMAAVISLSLLFAFVHFLEPPTGAVVPDPEALNAGFVLMGQILARYADPLSVIGHFMMLFSLAVVLAVARLRTASLWLPIGLHVGWVFSYQVFKSATWPVKGLPSMAEWLVGASLKEGLLPLTVVVITGVIVAMMTRPGLENPLGDG